MAKPIKILLGVVGVIVLLLVVAAIAIPLLFDPNDYRGHISKAVKDKTGRELALGEIKLSVFPWLRVRIADVSLSNAPGFGDQPMAAAKEAAVGVQLFPLLFDRQIKVSTVELDGLRLDLAKDASGKTNWDGLVKPSEEEKKPEDEKGPVDLDSIDIAGVSISDSAVSYRDAQSKQNYKLEKFSLETGNLKPGEPFDVETSLTAISEAQKLKADLALSAHITPDMKAQKVTVEKLKLDLKSKLDKIDAEVALAGDVIADLGTQLVQVSGLKLDFKTAMPDLEAKGTLLGKVKAGIKDKQYAVDGLDLKAVASGKSIPGGKQDLALSGKLDFNQASGAMTFSNAKIETAGLKVSTSITGQNMTGDAPRLSGPIRVEPFNPRELLTRLGQPDIKTTDPQVLKQVGLSARYSGSFKSLRLDDLKLTLDQTNASGSFGLRDFATQALEFALKVDQIDADRYLPPAASAPATPPKEKTATEKKDVNATELPIAALEKFNASGTVDIGTLKLKGSTMKNVRLRVDGPKGAPKLVKLDLQAYGGQIATSTRIGPGARPDYSLDTDIQAITLGPLLQQFMGKDLVTGLGNVKVNLTSGGKTVGDVRRGLNGDLSLSFQNGAVKGFNLGEVLRKGQALFKGQPYTAPAEPPQTDFTAINFSAKVINGILKTNELDARSPLFRLIGNGDVDLVNETLNYLAQPTVVGSAEGQGGKTLQDLAGLTIPIKLTGSWFSPKYKLDLQTALKQKAADEVRGKVADKLLGGESGKAVTETELKQKAGEKLNKELGRGLDKLFGGKKKQSAPATVPEPAPAEPAAETPPSEPAPAEAAPATP
jgi:AsmA protein